MAWTCLLGIAPIHSLADEPILADPTALNRSQDVGLILPGSSDTPRTRPDKLSTRYGRSNVGLLGSVRQWFAGSADSETLSVESTGNVDSATPSASRDAHLSPVSQTETESPVPTTTESPVVPTEIVTDEMPTDSQTVVSQTFPARTVSARTTPRHYARLDIIYWTATDPKPRELVFDVRRTPTPTDDINLRLSTDDPNTDHEIGLRAWWGREISDSIALEIGGLWSRSTNFIDVVVSQTQAAGALNPNPTVDQVFFDPTRTRIDFANMSFRSRYWGTELNARWHMLDGAMWTLDAVAGPRYFDYAERMAFEYDIDITTTPAPVTRLLIDRFEANNQLVGFQFGGDLELALLEYVSAGIGARFGLMGNIQDATGSTTSITESLLVDGSNNLGIDNTVFSPLIELNPAVIFELTPNITFQAGYTVIWIGNILRAAEQVDVIGIKQGRAPTLSLQNDDIFLHGFTFSLTANW